MNPMYDSALLGILQHEGKIVKFLDVIFGFLMRRTDFYHIMTPEQQKLGFPSGMNARMVIEIPVRVKSGKDLKVTIERKRIRVWLKSDGEEELYFDRSMCWDIMRDESVWTFNSKEEQIHFCLDKMQERWWEAVFEGEDKINTRKIDCSRPMHELDEEAQAKIHQLMYDQQCKRQGLPTSEQQKVHSLLAGAWDKEGSPFKGTPFDPSKIDVAPSNTS